MSSALTERLSLYAQSSGVVVETAYGRVRGIVEGNVHVFKGVPYGDSTGGSGRFMPPAKPKPWAGIVDATEFGPKSPQLPGTEIPEVAALTNVPGPMNEDCLRLNIWTPGPDGEKRPVMVWLHGGGFTGGSGAAIYYDGTRIAGKQNVVIVTLNHRLNAFGYLYLADIGGPKYAKASNAGMLDIVAALEYIRDNIAAFGGDPGNVTIFGQSGGGGKVSTLMAMPAAKGLFHRAIVQSGSALTGIPRSDATKSAETLLATLGLKANQTDELQKLPMGRILTAIQNTRGLRLGPVVDGSSLPSDPFEPSAPEVSADVPLMIGTVATEVTFFSGTPLDPLDDDELYEHVKQTTGAGDAEVERLIAVYRRSQPRRGNLDLYLALATDFGIRFNVMTQAERKAALGRAPVFAYYFNMTTPVRDGKLRSPHTLDIPYVFDNITRAAALTGGEDPHQIADKISRTWAAFARKGDPTHDRIPRWPAFAAGRRATMILGHDVRVANDPDREERLAIASLKASLG
jgi:para-nitrobenzyl esterase